MSSNTVIGVKIPTSVRSGKAARVTIEYDADASCMIRIEAEPAGAFSVSPSSIKVPEGRHARTLDLTFTRKREADKDAMCSVVFQIGGSRSSRYNAVLQIDPEEP
jgi:hypothetical protein